MLMDQASTEEGREPHFRQAILSAQQIRALSRYRSELRLEALASRRVLAVPGNRLRCVSV
jgi:hypothetical protein